MKKVIEGNHAVSWGVKLARAEVISAYPITPQTQIVERLSEMCADGTLDARYIHVESEHSAMAACIGASAAGARTFTATSAQGLALMHELLLRLNDAGADRVARIERLLQMGAGILQSAPLFNATQIAVLGRKRATPLAQ